MSGPQRLFSFLPACASSVIVARAQSQTTPGPEVKKLAVMVGKFTVEDELKAGAMGPNSPAMKFTGTDDCRWTAGGLRRDLRGGTLQTRKEILGGFPRLLRSDFQDIPIPRS